jgi:hypothetical protein
MLNIIFYALTAVFLQQADCSYISGVQDFALRERILYSLVNPIAATMKFSSKKPYVSDSFGYASWNGIKSNTLFILMPSSITVSAPHSRPLTVQILAGLVVCTYKLERNLYTRDHCIQALDPEDLQPGTYLPYPHWIVPIIDGETVTFRIPAGSGILKLEALIGVLQDWLGRPNTDEEAPKVTKDPAPTDSGK